MLSYCLTQSLIHLSTLFHDIVRVSAIILTAMGNAEILMHRCCTWQKYLL